jgi:hypothetical protein
MRTHDGPQGCTSSLLVAMAIVVLTIACVEMLIATFA